jgi:hypothetical protein
MPKKLPKILNPKEIREEAERKMTFSEKYEEELKRQLFEEDNNPQEVIEASDILLAETTVHKERSGEK